MTPSGIYLMEDQWATAGSDLSLGAAIGGREQYAANINPLWTARFSYRIPSTKYFEWEAWRDARLGRTLVDSVAPSTIRMHQTTVTGITFTGGVTFTSGVTFAGALDFGGAVLTVSSLALQFSSTIAIQNASNLTVGKFIWLAGQMYRVTGVSGEDVSVIPPLRQDYPLGTSVNGSGVIDMVLSDQSDGLLARGAQGYSDVSVSMIEAI